MTNEDIREMLVRMDERLENLSADVVELKHSVCGNGRPGLRVDVATLGTRVSAIEETAREGRVPMAAKVAIGLSVLTLIVEGLYHLI